MGGKAHWQRKKVAARVAGRRAPRLKSHRVAAERAHLPADAARGIAAAALTAAVYAYILGNDQ
ncbi:putative NIF3 family GTP cyclohydrolase 1 type 2 [Pseudochelatococcus contaminans]|uniref:Putative NIF3 family GTP cyclohydrolase 1 type 2 n=1 Tax=Pseudochelatococcus contaminans TaxID=1538103 RepID=A0A7W5Z3D6_9HYPH|nr:putative NIF3 family GTP cyclohydrolase 1 type 2 [Pseudochelatococcus contaminans]